MTTPLSRLLHEAGGIQVFHRPGTSDWTLVAFGPRQENFASDRWWGAALGRREGLDVIGIAPGAYDWFPRDIMAELVPVIRAAAKPAIAAFGFSMGGYGALKYASALGARAVLALSPQYSIDPADGTAGERSMTYFDPVRHRGMRITPGDYPDGSLLLWDPEEEADDRHARAIARLPGIRPVKLRLAGHATPAIFSETGRLVPVSEALISGRHEEAVAGIRTARREAPTVLLAASALLEARGHARWAAEAQQRAEHLPVNQGRAIEARARVMAKLGDTEGEIAALRAWLVATPKDFEPRLRLVGRLMALGRPDEAAEAARQSIEVGLADARMHDALREATAAARLAQPAPTTPAAAPRVHPSASRPAASMLGETAGIRLWHWPGQGPGTLVVFTPASGQPAGPANWWAHGLALRLGWTTLVFAAHAPHWYPADEMAALLPLALAAMPAERRVTYGLGMGGYAALKFGRALGADGTVALGPAWSIDPADMPDDRRSQRAFDPRRNAGMAVRPADLSLLPIVAFDSMLQRDAAQARRLAAMHRVIAVPIRRGGEALASVLVETGRLGALLSTALDGNGPRAVTILREARRNSPSVRAAVAAALEKRGRREWAAALLRPPAPKVIAATPPAADAGWRFAVQARALRQKRQYDAEEALARRWIETDPRSVDARLHLAQSLQLRDRHEDAAQAVREAMQAGLRDDRLHITLVRVMRHLERSAEALQAARAAVEAMPRDADTLALLGEICLWAEHPAEAQAAFLRALAEQPGHRLAGLGLAVMEPMTADGTPGPYLAALLEALAVGPAPEVEWLRTIDRLWHAERADAAIVAAREAQRLYPSSSALPLRLGRILLGAGREAEAAASFEARARLAPQDAQAWHGLLDALMVLRRNTEGREAAVQAASLHPQDALIATRHAAFVLALDEGGPAERAARRAIELDPEADGGYLILIDALRRQFRNRDAISVAREALDGPAGSVNIAMRLGRLLQDNDDPAGAAEVFARVTAMPGPPRQAWVGLAEALAAAGRPEEAEAAARAGLQVWPDARDLQAVLGQLLLVRGEADAARDALAQAIEAEAESPAVSLAMADAWLRQGRRREALQLLTAAVAAAPGHAEAEIRLGQLLLEEGRVDDAAALFTRICEAAPDMPAAWAGLSDAERLRKRVKPALEAYRRAVAAGADAQTVRTLRFRLFGEYD